jgi:head-tail adaptor
MGDGRRKAFDCVELKSSIQAEIGEEEGKLGAEEAERRHALWVRTSKDPLAAWWRSVLGNGAAAGPSPRRRKKPAAA